MYRYNSSGGGLSAPRFRSGPARSGYRGGAILGLLANLFDAFGNWHDRRRQRLALGRLDDRMLRDIGLTYADVEAEVTKPFWR